MAFDDRREGSTSATQLSGAVSKALTVLQLTVDCASDDVASGDKVRLFYLPAGAWVLGAGAYVETAEGGTLTFDIGLWAASNDAETDQDGFLNDANGNATGVKVTVAEAYAATGGYYCAAAQNLCATFNNAADAAKITFRALVMNFNVV